MLREGPLQRCQGCGQVFKLVRLRNEYSNEMDYYSPNFYIQNWQDMGEAEIPNVLSIHKMNTHYEPTVFENPENTVYSLINPDDHDRILTDPAYRMQKSAEAEHKARVFTMAMEDYEKEKWTNSPWREPIGKLDYENLIQAEVAIRKMDRQFRKLTKFHTRYSLTHSENTSTLPTTRGENAGCFLEPTNAGTVPTLYSLVTSPKKNNALGTTSRPTSRTTAKTSESKRYTYNKAVLGQAGAID